MIWLTWRQFRAQATAVYALLLVLAIALVATGPGLVHLAGAGGGTLLGRLSSLQTALYVIGELVLLAVPAVIGMFWGAPLITRELDAGTHRLVWNQGVTRTRWVGTKLVVTGLASTTAAGLLSLAVSLWAGPIDSAADASSELVGFYFPRVAPLTFDTRGVVPIGYAAFAFVLGVTLGALLRRTLPAMTLTVVGYVAARVAVAVAIRPHLQRAAQLTTAITTQNFQNFNGGITVGIHEPGSWVISELTIDASGRTVAAPSSALQACFGSAPGQTNVACFHHVTVGLRQLVTYQPANHFWALQSSELVVYLALAAILSGWCVWWIRHRAC